MTDAQITAELKALNFAWHGGMQSNKVMDRMVVLENEKYMRSRGYR
jgi:hypothetical protein